MELWAMIDDDFIYGTGTVWFQLQLVVKNVW